MTLAKRIEKFVMAKFQGDKRAALRYLRPKCQFYASKADSKRGTTYHQRWRDIYDAYSRAEFAIGYWLSCDEDFYREMARDDDILNEPNWADAIDHMTALDCGDNPDMVLE